MRSKITIFCLSALLCVSTSGCLSLQLGGKTHNCNGNPEAEMRIARLEQRINTLEHYAGITPSNPTQSSVGLAAVPAPAR